MFQVEIVAPEGPVKQCSFSEAEVLIGRKPSNSIVLLGSDVSGSHACLQVADGGVIVVDLGSTNGTFVNGLKVDVSPPLRVVDEVQIGGYLLRVTDGSALRDEPLAPVLREASRPVVAPEPLMIDAEGLDLPPLADFVSSGGPPLVNAPGEPSMPPLVGDAEEMPPLAWLPEVASPVSLHRTTPPLVRATTRSPPPVAIGQDVDADGDVVDLPTLWADHDVVRVRVWDLAVVARRAGEDPQSTGRVASLETLRGDLRKIVGEDLLRGPPAASRLADGGCAWASRAPSGRAVVALARLDGSPLPLSRWRADGRVDARGLDLLEGATAGRRPIVIRAHGGVSAWSLIDALVGLHGDQARGAILCGRLEPIWPSHTGHLFDVTDGREASHAIGLIDEIDVSWIAVLSISPEVFANWRGPGERGLIVAVDGASSAPHLDAAKVMVTLAPGPRGASDPCVTEVCEESPP